MLKRLAAEGYLEESYVATLEECLEHVRDGEQRQDCRNTVLSVFYAVCPAKLDHTCRCKSGHGNRQ